MYFERLLSDCNPDSIFFFFLHHHVVQWTCSNFRKIMVRSYGAQILMGMLILEGQNSVIQNRDQTCFFMN